MEVLVVEEISMLNFKEYLFERVAKKDRPESFAKKANLNGKLHEALTVQSLINDHGAVEHNYGNLS